MASTCEHSSRNRNNDHESLPSQKELDSVAAFESLARLSDWSEWKKYLPCGVRFTPDEQDLVDLLVMMYGGGTICRGLISKFDLYDYDPDNFPPGLVYPHDGKMYIFTSLHKLHKNGTKLKRNTPNGFWKMSSSKKDEARLCSKNGQHIATKTSLAYHTKKNPEATEKTQWLMQEYRLGNPQDESNEHALCVVYLFERERSGDKKSTDNDEGQISKPNTEGTYKVHSGASSSNSVSGPSYPPILPKPCQNSASKPKFSPYNNLKNSHSNPASNSNHLHNYNRPCLIRMNGFFSNHDPSPEGINATGIPFPSVMPGTSFQPNFNATTNATMLYRNHCTSPYLDHHQNIDAFKLSCLHRMNMHSSSLEQTSNHSFLPNFRGPNMSPSVPNIHQLPYDTIDPNTGQCNGGNPNRMIGNSDFGINSDSELYAFFSVGQLNPLSCVTPNMGPHHPLDQNMNDSHDPSAIFTSTGLEPNPSTNLSKRKVP